MYHEGIFYMFPFPLFLVQFFNIFTVDALKFRGLVNGLIKQKSNKIQAKIIGGQAVDLESYPFQVQIFNLGALCSGTIINSWTVLTSAHCFDRNNDPDEIMIQAGSRYVYDFSANVYHVKKIEVYNGYNVSMQFENDIALIFMKESFIFGNVSKKAILVHTDKWMDPKEKNFTVTGWGWTKYGGPISELGLMMTHLRYVSAEECNRMHKLTITPDMFCLYGGGSRDTCKGDSGGGVLWNGMIVGITSHGDGCAKKHKPSVYTNVYYFRDWIEKQVYKFIKTNCESNFSDKS